MYVLCVNFENVPVTVCRLLSFLIFQKKNRTLQKALVSLEIPVEFAVNKSAT